MGQPPTEKPGRPIKHAPAGRGRQPWALLGLVAALGCQSSHRSEPAELPAGHIEVRGADGNLLFGLRRRPADLRIVDAHGIELGRIETGDAGARLVGGAGAPISTQATASGLDLIGPKGLRARVGPVDGVLRIADGNGIPLGRVRTQGGEVVLFDAGGTPIAHARTEGGRIVVTNRDGAAQGFVTGDVPLERAVLAFLHVLPTMERALLLAQGPAVSPGIRRD